MNTPHFKIIFFFLIVSFFGRSQELVRGELIDKSNGEPVFGAIVKVDGIGKAKTDFDGVFSFKLNPGKFTLTFSKPAEGYIDEQREIEVIPDQQLSFRVEIGKSKSVQELSEVKVIGKASTDTPPVSIKASDKRRMDESAASDELPKETIRNSGVNNAADAVSMVPAASVEDGKNVYIRGLGDRYTKTVLNGMDIPGLDPDRNSVQMDIFPAVLIDNITVYKTFTPNLTADFTGGLINISTRDFPIRKTLYAKAGFGYNTNATFNPDFISYQGGSLDFLGFDDGIRSQSINSSIGIPHPSQGDVQTEVATKSFSDIMSTQKANAFLNQNYAFAIGDQKDFARRKDSLQSIKYGYNFVLNYRSSNTLYKDVQYNEYIRDTDLSETKLFRDRASSGELTESDVLWTSLLGNSIKFGKSKISLILLHTQNGTSSAANLVERNYDSNQATLVKQGLQYTQRSVSNANLNGTHLLGHSNKWKMKWNLSPTFSKISNPDIRSTALERVAEVDANSDTNYVYKWEESVGAEIRRIFRSLTEYNLSAKMDFDYTFNQWDSLKSTLKFGFLNTYKNRSFDVAEYVFRLYNMSNIVPNDPDWFFEPENIWTVDKGQGVYATGQQEKANIYQASQNTSAAYIMNELPISKAFDVTYGARLENNVNWYTGESNNAAYDSTAPRYNNEVVLDEMNILPSINMVYKVRKMQDSVHRERNTNFRAAYTQTLARPSFREISISQIYDPIQGRRYLGNIDLKQTLIHNADIRWEYFFGRTELISASAFYKKFINPIEVVANVAAPNEFMPVNAGEADVYGAEFEIRKVIGPETKKYRLVVGGNFTYVVSKIDMNKITTTVGGVEFTEKEVRENNAREGEVIGDYRPMYGQAPYIINGFLNYRNDELRLMINLNYNVQGKKLAVIGVGSLPDVYEQPFHDLNLKISKKLGKIHDGEDDPRWNLSLRASNLLNNARRRYYEAYQAESQVFDYLNQGITFSGSISYTIR